MLVCDFPQGRYDNAIFRYLASSLFCILYDEKEHMMSPNVPLFFSEADFITWSNQILAENSL